VELERVVTIPLALFINKVLLGKCTDICGIYPWKTCRRQGYISKNLFQKLFVDGILLITKLKSNMKGAVMKVSDKILLRKRAIIETVNDELKNIAQEKHSRHRRFDNFVVNLLGALATYCCFPKKPCINVEWTMDTQLSFF